MINKEINEHIELARQSGYNEACYLNEKKLKEIEEELIKIIPYKTTSWAKLMKLEIKQIFAKHSPHTKIDKVTERLSGVKADTLNSKEKRK